MVFPTQYTVVSSTTNGSATGTTNFGTIANKWAVQVISSGQIGRPTLNFSVSCDGTNFALAMPANQITNQFGRWLEFDVPCQYLTVTMGANLGTVAVYAVAQSD